MTYSSTPSIGCLLSACIIFPILYLMQGCISLGAPDTYNYLTSIYVETDEGLRKFSAVREVTYRSGVALEGLKPEHQASVKGEAIPVILPDGTAYFALIDQDEPRSTALHALVPIARNMANDPDDISDIMRQLDGEYDLPRKMTLAEARGTAVGLNKARRDELVKTWPTFITFSNPNDPASMEVVDPADIPVQRVTVQITKNKIEPRVESLFSEDFWKKWERLRKRPVPQRKGDANGFGAPYYQYSEWNMKQ